MRQHDDFEPGRETTSAWKRRKLGRLLLSLPLLVMYAFALPGIVSETDKTVLVISVILTLVVIAGVVAAVIFAGKRANASSRRPLSAPALRARAALHNVQSLKRTPATAVAFSRFRWPRTNLLPAMMGMVPGSLTLMAEGIRWEPESFARKRVTGFLIPFADIAAVESGRRAHRGEVRLKLRDGSLLDLTVSKAAEFRRALEQSPLGQPSVGENGL